MEWGISDMLSTLEATIFVRKTVKELLFEGYEDTVMELGSTFGDDSEGDYEDYDNDDDYDDDNDDDDEEEEEEDDDKENVFLDKFGWFYKVCTEQLCPLSCLSPRLKCQPCRGMAPLGLMERLR